MTKVKLRSKLIKGAKKCIFLDFYPPIINPNTGKKKRWEYLKMYIYTKPKSDIEKTHNCNTFGIAEKIRAERQIEIQNHQYGFLSDSMRKSSFIDYFEDLLEKKKEKNLGVWHCTLKHLRTFTDNKLNFSDVTLGFCNGFREYLLQVNWVHSPKYKVHQNTAHTYLVALKSVLKKAYSEGYLQKDISINIKSIKMTETVRSYLTIDELNKLVHTPCRYPYIKEAALFSVLTGMRISDIIKLTWSEVHEVRNTEGKTKFSIHYRQKKTKSVEVLPISEQAYNLLGVRGEQNDKVFKLLKYSAHNNELLKYWLVLAGINKKLSWHNMRHTYATLQLSAGTDLFTVSKMLGHRNITTTQVYAKVVDKSKLEAADKIQLDFAPMVMVKERA